MRSPPQTESAIQAVLNGQRWVDLPPASSSIRRIQHEMARQHNWSPILMAKTPTAEYASSGNKVNFPCLLRLRVRTAAVNRCKFLLWQSSSASWGILSSLPADREYCHRRPDPRSDHCAWKIGDEPAREILLSVPPGLRLSQSSVHNCWNKALVISDRYADSTLAYQGYGHGVDLRYYASSPLPPVGLFPVNILFDQMLKPV